MMEFLPQIFIWGCRNTMSNVVGMLLFIQLFLNAFSCFLFFDGSDSIAKWVVCLLPGMCHTQHFTASTVAASWSRWLQRGECKGGLRNTWLIYAGYSVRIAQEWNTVISTPESFQVEFCQIWAIKQCLLILTCLKQAGNSIVIQMVSLRQSHLPLTWGKWRKLQKIWRCCVLKPMWEYRLR